MTESLKVQLLGKLISEKEIVKSLRNKKSEYLTQNIKPDHLNSYIEDGWKLDKEFKSFTRIKQPKPFDIAFEDRVWCLFAQMDYKFLNRDRNFSLPYDKLNNELTKQIDVIAVDDESIMLVECKAAKENRRGDFKKELESYKGIIEGLRLSLRQLFPNKKYKFKFILATKNFSISEEDLERLRNIGGLHLNEENIDYFFELYNQLGLASKYQFLGYIFDKQEIPEMENRVPAVEGNMGGHTYYSFSLEPEKLLKIGYVLHRNKANINMMPTYQRLVKKARLKSVSEFINEGGYFPNSIVINIDAEKCQFDVANNQVNSTLSRIGVLHLPRKYRSAYIIDGQHRLYGYSNSEFKAKNTIPVVAFLNLSREEQVRLFMQINENQKAVSKDLRNTLNADLLWTSDSYVDQIRALCSRVSIYLGENRESALFNKVSIGEDKKIITTQAIENALKKSGFLGKVTKTKIEELGSIYNGDLDDTYHRLRDYINAGLIYISENLEEEWKREDSMILINKGIYGLIMIMNDILLYLRDQLHIDIKKPIKLLFHDVKPYLEALVNFIINLTEEEKNQLKSSYGAGGETKYWRTFQKAIQDQFPNFKPQGLDDYLKKQEREYNNKAFSIIRELETFFKNDFRNKLEEHFGKKWFKKGVPPKIADKAIVDALNKNRNIDDEDKEVEHWDCLTIIAYREIATANWQSIFEKDYTRPGEEKMRGGKDEKTKWMVKLEHLRNQNVHSYFVTEEELSFLEELHDWLIKKNLRSKFQIQHAAIMQ